MVHVAPSILAADFAKLGEQVLETELAGANRIHVDVMDGHYVPNLSMGPAVVKSLAQVTWMPMEIHLMVEEPFKFIEPFLAADSDTLIAHYEVLPDPGEWLRQVKEKGKRAGLAINPETPVEVVEPFLPQMDVALCMTVHPGFAGQRFLPESPARIRRLREMINQYNPACELEVDGGIDANSAPLAVEAGANVLVAATAVFGHPKGPGDGVRALREVAQAALHPKA